MDSVVHENLYNSSSVTHSFLPCANEVVVECYSGLEVFSILHSVSAVHYLPI